MRRKAPPRTPPRRLRRPHPPLCRQPPQPPRSPRNAKTSSPPPCTPFRIRSPPWFRRRSPRRLWRRAKEPQPRRRPRRHLPSRRRSLPPPLLRAAARAPVRAGNRLPGTATRHPEIFPLNPHLPARPPAVPHRSTLRRTLTQRSPMRRLARFCPARQPRPPHPSPRMTNPRRPRKRPGPPDRCLRPRLRSASPEQASRFPRPRFLRPASPPTPVPPKCESP